MKTLLISFASSPKWCRSQENLNKSAENKGVNGYISYNLSNLEKEFFDKNKDILNNYTRGCGYWMWKSCIFKQAIEKLEDNDILLYVDSGHTIINNLNYIIEQCKKDDIVFFNNMDKKKQHFNRKWTKRDCYVLMDCDDEIYYDAPQVDASIMLFKKCDFVKKFLDEFYYYANNRNIITDLPNITKPNLPEFHDHRHDQSILSIMAKKYNINLLPQPSQFGSELERPYEQLFYHHRGVF
jgi:hypothetical protein